MCFCFFFFCYFFLSRKNLGRGSLQPADGLPQFPAHFDLAGRTWPSCASILQRAVHIPQASHTEWGINSAFQCLLTQRAGRFGVPILAGGTWRWLFVVFWFFWVFFKWKMPSLHFHALSYQRVSTLLLFSAGARAGWVLSSVLVLPSSPVSWQRSSGAYSMSILYLFRALEELRCSILLCCVLCHTVRVSSSLHFFFL